MKREDWEEILGKTHLENLCNNFLEVREYFEGRRYAVPKDIKEINYIMDEENEIVDGFIEETNIEFVEFYKPFFVYGYNKLLERIDKFHNCEKTVYSDFMRVLANEMTNIGIRILLLEYEKFKESGRTYTEYCSLLKDQKFRGKLLNDYPAFADSIFRCINRSVDLFSEIVQRFATDKRSIEKSLFNGGRVGKLKRISGGLSDYHRNGKKVFKIIFETGQELIYKPHNIKNEKWFNEFAAFLGEQCGLKMYIPEIVVCEEYGWVEYVAYETCLHMEELERYYKRIGVYLFVAYLLGTNDLHCENLIVKGEYPVIVDLENISCVQEKKSEQTTLFLKEKLGESVLRSGILPHFYWGNGKLGVDLSALSGGGCKTSFKIFTIKAAGTENVHVEYENAQITEKYNKAVLNHEYISPSSFEKEILDGFGKTYKYAEAHRENVFIRLQEIRKFSCRYLVTNTQKYNMLLQSSYHPFIMSDDQFARKLFLCLLWKNRNFDNEIDQRLVNAEIEDLLSDDVPYFYFFIDEYDLYDSQGNQIKQYFSDTAFNQIKQRLKKLSVLDMNFQISLIRVALSGYKKIDISNNFRLKKIRNIIASRDSYDKNDLLELAEWIGQRLISRVVYDSKKVRVNWISFNILAEKSGAVNISPCSIYLYDGISGILVFLFILSKYTSNSSIVKMYHILEQQIYDYTCGVRECRHSVYSNNSGLYNGEASIVYTYLILYWYSRDKKYLQYAIEHSEILEQVSCSDKNVDLVDGKAGAVYTFCQLYKVTLDEKFLQKAQYIAVDIIKSSENIGEGIGWKQKNGNPPLLGMAHGNAGIMVALLLLFSLTHNEKYYKIFQKALIYEHQNYDSNKGEWRDFRDGASDLLESPIAWCHGSGGIFLSRMLFCKMELKEAELKLCVEEADKALKYAEKHKAREGLCLCHGECGNNLIFNKFDCDKTDRKYRKIEDYNQGTILAREWYNPGLMNGLAGIGYYLLMCLPGMKDYIILLEE